MDKIRSHFNSIHTGPNKNPVTPPIPRIERYVSLRRVAPSLQVFHRIDDEILARAVARIG
jgi:hypothetical protein